MVCCFLSDSRLKDGLRWEGVTRIILLGEIVDVIKAMPLSICGDATHGKFVTASYKIVNLPLIPKKNLYNLK